MIIITTISVLVISGGIYLARMQWPSFKVCPICAGVSGTWAWMLLAYYLSYSVDMTMLGILMGGSVVGIAYQLEKRLQSEKRMVWKIFFIPVGLVMVHGLIELSLLKLILSSAVIGVLLYIFFSGQSFERIMGRNKKEVLDIEEKMKNCC